jgi:hypothetical protein
MELSMLFLKTLFFVPRMVFVASHMALYGVEGHRGEMARLSDGQQLFCEALYGSFISGLITIVVVYGIIFINKGTIL